MNAPVSVDVVALGAGLAGPGAADDVARLLDTPQIIHRKKVDS